MDNSNMSNSSSSPEEQQIEDQLPPSPKRKFSEDKEKPTVNANGRQVKRRASKACQSCRQRKVRCNVVEHGSPCTNCRLDQVNCVVTESKRRKKHTLATSISKPPLDSIHENAHDIPHSHNQRLQHVHRYSMSSAEAMRSGSINPLDLQNSEIRSFGPLNGDLRRHSGSSDSNEDEDMHVPHPLYANQQRQRLSFNDPRAGGLLGLAHPIEAIDIANIKNEHSLLNSASIHGDLRAARLQTPPAPVPRSMGPLLPAFLKQLPQRMTADDVQYLYRKGALTLPPIEFRNELLRCFVEYVYPYMPLVELQDFLRIIDKGTGEDGKVSLILFQAIMFTGVAFIDMAYLRRAGFATRKAARKAFYAKARLLYDFDYEQDRVALVQSLLLMTYWYETPDDQKDTWHWMGVAISLAHTIGLHRDPKRSNMDPGKKMLWKRIWWSCFMRDRLVALGMRRPTRIKDEDYDVPMLEMEDFEIEVLPADNQIISSECTMIRSLEMQRDLAFLCIAKAKLALCISHVLSSQYSVLVRDQGTAQGTDGNTRSNVMLVPKKVDQSGEVRKCGQELRNWKEELPEKYKHHKVSAADLANGNTTMVVQKALLQMIYWATVSALHRPQVLPPAETASAEKLLELRDESRQHVRNASRYITDISSDLHELKLERYLPTTGVTVLLPAIIIHLLDIKSNVDVTRMAALNGFCQCMLVLEQLRENYAAADYATQFLEAAIRKAQIDVGMDADTDKAGMIGPGDGIGLRTLPPKRVAQNVSQLLDSNKNRFNITTPPPDGVSEPVFDVAMNSHQVQDNANTPPGSDTSNGMNGYDPTISSNALGDSFQLSLPAKPMTSEVSKHLEVPLPQHGIMPMNDDLIDWSACEPSNNATASNSNMPTSMEGNTFDWNMSVPEGNFENALQDMDAHGETGGFAFGDIVDGGDWMKDVNADMDWQPDAMDAVMSFA